MKALEEGEIGGAQAGASSTSVADLVPTDPYGLVMRRTHSAFADGSVTTVIEIYSEDLALKSLEDDSLDNTESA